MGVSTDPSVPPVDVGGAGVDTSGGRILKGAGVASSAAPPVDVKGAAAGGEVVGLGVSTGAGVGSASIG